MQTGKPEEFIFVRLSEISKFLDGKLNNISQTSFLEDFIPKKDNQRYFKSDIYESFPVDNKKRIINISQRIKQNNFLKYAIFRLQKYAYHIPRILWPLFWNFYFKKEYNSYRIDNKLINEDDWKTDIIIRMVSGTDISNPSADSSSKIGTDLEKIKKQYYIDSKVESMTKDELIEDRKKNYFRIIKKELNIGISFEPDGCWENGVYEFKVCSTQAPLKTLKKAFETGKGNLNDERGTFEDRYKEAKIQVEIEAFLLKKKICEIEIFDAQKMELSNFIFKADYNYAREIIKQFLIKLHKNKDEKKLKEFI